MTAPYASVEQLAEKMHLRVTEANTPALTNALGAASEEIDHDLDRVDPLPDPPPDVVVSVCLARAAEHYKAVDAAYGIIGVEDIGTIRAPKDGFARYVQSLTPYKQGWGVA